MSLRIGNFFPKYCMDNLAHYDEAFTLHFTIVSHPTNILYISAYFYYNPHKGTIIHKMV